MSVDRSQTQPAALPPTDHVARVLLKRGARDDAMSFLRAAIARDPEERACAALLKAIEARPDASVYGPELALDPQLVEAYARSGRLIEALAVLRGAELDVTPTGRRWAEMLEALLAPPDGRVDDELAEVDSQLRTGGAAVALTMLSERIERDAFVPEWARNKHALLSQLLLEAPDDAPEDKTIVGDEGRGELGTSLAKRFGRRDAEGALADARTYAAHHPGDVDAQAVVQALEGLVGAMSTASAERSAPLGGTQPMHGHTVALFQLRMGNLSEAERLFRKLVLEQPLDRLARQRLDDVQVVREMVEGRPVTSARPPRRRIDPLMETARDASIQHATPIPILSEAAFGPKETEPLEAEPTRRERIGDGPTPAPIEGEPTVRGERPAIDPPTVEVHFDAVTRETEVDPPSQEPKEQPRKRARIPSSPDMLSKVSRKLTPDEGWAPAPASEEIDWDEQETEVGSLEDEAELLLVQGYVDKALEAYDILVTAQPNRPELARRREEIRELQARESEPVTSVEVRSPSEELDLDAEPTLVTTSPFDQAEDEDAEVRVHRIITIA